MGDNFTYQLIAPHKRELPFGHAALPIPAIPGTPPLTVPVRKQAYIGPEGVKRGIHDGQRSPVESLDMVGSAEPDWDSDTPLRLTG
jgi:hypothetical protein